LAVVVSFGIVVMGSSLTATPLGIKIMVKNMKYFISIFCTMLLIARINFSQTHQIYFSSGYNIPTTTSVLAWSVSDNRQYQQYISTYSKGIVIQGGYQFEVTNNFALDLNINYLPGFSNEKYFKDRDSVFYSFTNSNISISPTLIIKFNVADFIPYAKFGFSVNFISFQESETIFRDKTIFSYSKDFTMGFVSGIGINYIINKSFCVFFETQLNSITYFPDELEITKYNPNGTITTKNVKLENNFNIDLNVDEIWASRDFPFSSIGLILGLRLSL
jgi:hypothetical protein